MSGNSNSEKKIGFLFGAGVETDYYGLPSGNQYTNETILTKRSDLYEELSKFYKERVFDSYAGKYEKWFMFQKDSNAYKEIVCRAVRAIIDGNEDGYKSNDEYINDLIDAVKKVDVLESNLDNVEAEDKKKAEDSLKSLVQEKFEEIIEDLDKDNFDSNKQKHKELKEHFSYHGSIEKDFSSINNPKEAGNRIFWRLINYFWNAYFSLIIPMLENSNEYNLKMKNRNKYKVVLEDIKGITEHLYSENYLGAFSDNSDNRDYYEIIKKEFKVISGVLTTNYTPFVKRIGLEDDIIAFLAGQLSIFEVPYKLKTIDICSEENVSNELIFPFMYTQAPVKPIIEPRSIGEYAKMIKLLEEIDCLIIIGYAINENDNHINAFLREYLTTKAKSIVYCYYANEVHYEIDAIKDGIYEKLKISGKEVGNESLVVIENRGDAKDLVKEIKRKIK